jgi:hypothetical protein
MPAAPSEGTQGLCQQASDLKTNKPSSNQPSGSEINIFTHFRRSTKDYHEVCDIQTTGDITTSHDRGGHLEDHLRQRKAAMYITGCPEEAQLSQQNPACDTTSSF